MAVMAKSKVDGKIMVDIEAMGRLRIAADCGEEEDGVELTSGTDDKYFLLSKIP